MEGVGEVDGGGFFVPLDTAGCWCVCVEGAGRR